MEKEIMLLPKLPDALIVRRNAHGLNHFFTALQMDQYGRDCADAAIEAARQERDALKADAERYRWLRDSDAYDGWFPDYYDGAGYDRHEIVVKSSERNLDAAINGAIQGML